MPTFDVKCPRDGKVREVRVKSLDDAPPCECGERMEWVPSLATNHVTEFKPFWHPHLGHRPVYIDSWKTYRNELAKVGRSNVLAT